MKVLSESRRLRKFMAGEDLSTRAARILPLPFNTKRSSFTSGSQDTVLCPVTLPATHLPQRASTFPLWQEILAKMSRLISEQLGQPASEECGRDPQDFGHHSNHLYTPMSNPTTDQPLALTKNSMNSAHSHVCSTLAPGAPHVERQQNRPSVITCVPASNRNYSLSHSLVSHDACPTHDDRPASMIDEHFRRSLGRSYREVELSTNSVSISGSVDEHFAKALGETWQHIKAQGGVSNSTEPAL
ncbi:hypothetical protein AAFF_G00208030 [Aldrovandia affinis]|uniref:Transcription cofactor vestigial-like protein 4 n=1 Tax=Aldrovandia affinis TaxID=143900 RepID=A0AAD7RHF4_9TELE|nr:hypothetical protein AAFF_G00208030 [Aldrovandia affinis]